MLDEQDEATRVRFACKCPEPVVRYNMLHDDCMCATCKRWVHGFLRYVPTDRPLMPFTGAWRETHPQKRIRYRRIAEVIADGVDSHRVAEIFGVGMESVRKACAEYGVTCHIREDKRKNIGTMKILKALIDRPERSLGKIGKDMGISKQRVFAVYTVALASGVPGVVIRTNGHRQEETCVTISSLPS